MADVIDNMREDIQNAFKEAETQSTDTGGDAGTVDVQATDVTPADTTTGDDSGAAESTTPTTRERDASGKFAPVTPAKGAEDPLSADKQPKDPTAEITPAPAPGDTAIRAPATWTPEAREEWAKVPPRAQQEIARREQQVSEALRTSADARRVHQELQQVIQPYMGTFQAEGVHPLQAIGNVLQTANALRHGNPGFKASVMAHMIKNFGIDIQMLDTHLSSMQSGGQPLASNPVDTLLDSIRNEIAPVKQFMGQMQNVNQQRAQQASSAVEGEFNAFMDSPQNEFANDVRLEMAALMDVAAQRGQVLTLQDAYKRATMAHPEISALIHRRNTMGQSQAAQRAQAAASLQDNGAPSQDGNEAEGDGSLRSDLVSAMRAASSRGNRF